MSGSADSSYKCTLPPDVLAKAKRELREDPDTRIFEVKTLRSRLEKVPGLKPRTDFNFLLAFLRARKFDQERTFQLLKNYYEIRRTEPEIFDDLKPSRIKHILDDGLFEILKERDSEGCKVVILRPGNWDPDRFPVAEIPRADFLLFSKLVEDEITQVNGIHFIINLEGMTMKHVSHFGPALAKKVMQILQDVVPLRLKRIDYVNEPTFFDIVFSIVKQFMKEKLTKRIVLNGSEFDKLHQSIKPIYLPTDLGGTQKPHKDQEVIKALLASESRFIEDMKFGFLNMSIKKDKNEVRNADAGIQGLGGSFKKLDI
ncbi:unnamed protein product [Lymnaea stagnalis]|uniref:CRAL-TRIO domain-containing protein n=1 Tax=Lymnaea stagnalis TaxID=6523 RepID=A0AAV2I0R7_LYMST